MYDSGRGVTKDEAEALNWLRKAAEQGDASAQFQLGVRYANGEGVAKDETAAYMWYLLAGAKGNENARKNIPIIEKTLTSEQRAEGQRMAKDWKPKKALGQVDEAREWLAKALEIGGKELNLRALDDEELAAVW